MPKMCNGMVHHSKTPPTHDAPVRGSRKWSKPKLEVADVFRRYGDAYRRTHGWRLSAAQRRVLRELAACRTAAMGGHVNRCGHCGHGKQAYNSCRNRLCGKCRGKDRVDWYQQQARLMLPVEYLHAVFTVPDEIARLTRRNPELLYNLLFHAASRALLRTGRELLDVELGLVLVLHSWGQLLNHHPHVHVLLPAGGISTADGRWIALPSGETLPKQVLRERFQKTFLKRVKRLYRAGRLALDGELAGLKDPEAFSKWHEALAARRWVVYIDPATAYGDPRDPDHGEQIVRYMARYASGMVLSNYRLISIDDGEVKFFYKDYRDGARRKVKTLPADEFIDRFLAHVLPRGMRHKRYHGFMAPKGRRKRLQQIRRMLGAPELDAVEDEAVDEGEERDSSANLAVDEEATKGYPCPVCGVGRMVRGATMPRPTIWQILTMPFPDEKVIDECRRRIASLPEEPSWTAWPRSPVSCPEYRQRLLPLVFT